MRVFCKSGLLHKFVNVDDSKLGCHGYGNQWFTGKYCHVLDKPLNSINSLLSTLK